ncbi:MAG: RNA polymerase sigma factor [Solirubrobacteraceae bacterium]
MAGPERHRQERFEALFKRCHPQVHAYVLRRAPPAFVEDVVSETFLVAWRALDSVPGEPLPWLYGVARRTLANHNRGHRRSIALDARLTRTLVVPPEQEGLVSEKVEPRLRDALLSLTVREREAVLLLAWEGLSPVQAASALDCSSAAFRVRLHRARRHLAQLLEHAQSEPAETERPAHAGCALTEPLSKGGDR